mmetsp:Transcript_27350/g.31221  ORF Transcript_27350/g.31221 Transcript_27350/m.31221 type:complete len:395 (+) Transcript_27350:48-1232(+)|eukprot:CAMPEP_0194146276 /NCGR_PEP_ID=MMETSP0152-20130528/20493_1 /TAXON_ID=1049557 /ORGANISM="Thalassiothrix antarctica, Strain L6-D1" /LENGTH=394 /DNA_ID=CAMNT_0038846759 /DNA_START=21 /DNA_END=1205 /DNA_ORIENTATION=+
MANRVRVVVALAYWVFRVSSIPLRSLDTIAFIRGGLDRSAESDTSQWKDDEEVDNKESEDFIDPPEIENRSKTRKTDVKVMTEEGNKDRTEEEMLEEDAENYSVPDKDTDEQEDYAEIEEVDIEEVDSEDVVEVLVHNEEARIDDERSQNIGAHDQEKDEIEVEESWQENECEDTFETEVIHHTIDDDSSAFVDREELADAYDDDETDVSSPSIPEGHTEGEDRVSIDDIPGADQPTSFQEYKKSIDPETEDFTVLDSTAVDSSITVNPTIIDSSTTDPSGMDSTIKDAAVKKRSPINDIITKEIEQILIKECGFKTSEIKGLNVHIANIIADRKLRRPLDGIPNSWYNGKQKTIDVTKFIRKILIVAVPIVFGTLTYQNLSIGRSEINSMEER